MASHEASTCAAHACVRAFEGRLRVAKQKGLLREDFGPIPELSVQHCINENKDGASANTVIRYLKKDGVYAESNVPFLSTERKYDQGWQKYKSGDFVEAFSDPCDRHNMEYLMRSLDVDGPFVAEYMVLDHHDNNSILTESDALFMDAGSCWSHCVVVSGFETAGWCSETQRILGHWKFVNSAGPDWGYKSDGTGRIDFNAVGLIYIPSIRSRDLRVQPRSRPLHQS